MCYCCSRFLFFPFNSVITSWQLACRAQKFYNAIGWIVHIFLHSSRGKYALYSNSQCNVLFCCWRLLHESLCRMFLGVVSLLLLTLPSESPQLYMQSFAEISYHVRCASSPFCYKSSFRFSRLRLCAVPLCVSEHVACWNQDVEQVGFSRQTKCEAVRDDRLLCCSKYEDVSLQCDWLCTGCGVSLRSLFRVSINSKQASVCSKVKQMVVLSVPQSLGVEGFFAAKFESVDRFQAHVALCEVVSNALFIL